MTRGDGNFLKARQEAKKGELDEQLRRAIKKNLKSMNLFDPFPRHFRLSVSSFVQICMLLFVNISKLFQLLSKNLGAIDAQIAVVTDITNGIVKLFKTNNVRLFHCLQRIHQ